MSAFLAPIHTWVFNKIKLFEGLEGNVVEALSEKFGDEVNNIFISAAKHYGAPLEDKPIEYLIDTSNIHGWLQGRIEIAETREAAVITEVFNRFGKEAVDLVFEVYAQHGNDCGFDANVRYKVSTAPEIYKALNNYLLDGMPCDIVNTVTLNEEDKVEWQNVVCLHRGYWESVSADINIFYKLRAVWIKAFVESSNELYTYNITEAEIEGKTGFIHEIVKK